MPVVCKNENARQDTKTWPHTHIYEKMYIYKCIYKLICIDIHMYIYIYRYIPIYIYMYMCIYINMCIYKYMNIYTHVFIYIYDHMMVSLNEFPTMNSSACDAIGGSCICIHANTNISAWPELAGDTNYIFWNSNAGIDNFQNQAPPNLFISVQYSRIVKRYILIMPPP